MQQQREEFYEGMIAETVYFEGYNDETIQGYFARPITESIKGGVLVIFEAFGMVEHTKELVRKFAANGYYSIAPDLYWRDGYVDPVDMRAVRKAMGELPDTQAIADMQAATNFLKNQPNCSGKIGVIGHCTRGRHSMLFACNSDDVNAAVNCYGGRVIPDELTEAMPVAVYDMLSNLKCPVLGLFGESDRNPDPEQVSKIEKRLNELDKDFSFHIYPEPVGHGFFADWRPTYDLEASTDGWERIFEFFKKHLK